VRLEWEECGGGGGGGGGEACQPIQLPGHVSLHLFNCSVTCRTTPAQGGQFSTPNFEGTGENIFVLDLEGICFLGQECTFFPRRNVCYS
jgi:hypothetical protein